MTEFVDLVTWRFALRHPQGPSDPTVRHVLLTLATWADSDGSRMFPGTEALAIACRRSRNTVAKALNDAVRDGWVYRTERGGRGPYGKRRYAYDATLPVGWANQNQTSSRWDCDPRITSERMRRRRLAASRRAPDAAVVPQTLGDMGAAIVPPPLGDTDGCPPSEEVMSPNSDGAVPQLASRGPPAIEHDLFKDPFSDIFRTSSSRMLAHAPCRGEKVQGFEDSKPEPSSAGITPAVQQASPSPKSRPDNSEAIRQLLQLGERPGDIVRVLSGRGVTLADVLALNRG